MKLILAKTAPAEQVMQFRSEFLKVGEKSINGSRGLHNYEIYEDWLNLVEECEKPDNTFIGVQTSTYFAVRKSDEKIIGCIELRHTLNEALQTIGGHIGYSVLPNERRKGYATRMLKLMLAEAKKAGISRVLLTCDVDNVASCKTVEKCGGVLEREEPFVYKKDLYYKYWITVMKEKKERKLTEAEQKRKEEFEKLTEKLIAEGYTPNHITMSVLAANVFAIVAVLPFVIPLLIFYFLRGNELTVEPWSFVAVYAIFVIFIAVHELIHGITWAFFAKDGWKSISFGFIKEYLTPYCSCNQPMKKYQIIIGAFMPTFVLGIIPGIIAVFIGSSMLLFVSIFMILGGGGDLLIIFKLLQYKSISKETLFIDHPYELGTAVFERSRTCLNS